MNSNKYSSAVAERSLVNSGRDCAFHPRELASDLVRGQSNKQHRSYGHLRCCPARNGDDHRCAQGVGGGVLLLLHVLVGQNAQWSCNNNDTEHKDDAIAIVVYLNAHRHRSWLIKTPTTKTNTWHRHHHDHHSARSGSSKPVMVMADGCSNVVVAIAQRGALDKFQCACLLVVRDRIRRSRSFARHMRLLSSRADLYTFYINYCKQWAANCVSESMCAYACDLFVRICKSGVCVCVSTNYVTHVPRAMIACRDKGTNRIENSDVCLCSFVRFVAYVIDRPIAGFAFCVSVLAISVYAIWIINVTIAFCNEFLVK